MLAYEKKCAERRGDIDVYIVTIFRDTTYVTISLYFNEKKKNTNPQEQ
jgi:hypothetical protein